MGGQELRVEPNRYVLYVSRLERENAAHLVIEVFRSEPRRLLIVGDAPRSGYISSQSAAKDKRIIFTGFVLVRTTGHFSKTRTAMFMAAGNTPSVAQVMVTETAAF